jgi:hypothetical protein
VPPEIDHHKINENLTFTFCVMYGKMRGGIIIMGGHEMAPTSDYDDDIAFCFGPQRIYLKRHIIRALEAAKAQLVPLVKQSESIRLKKFFEDRGLKSP